MAVGLVELSQNNYFYNMDSIDFGYSMKNIPLPRKESHIYKLIDKTE